MRADRQDSLLSGAPRAPRGEAADCGDPAAIAAIGRRRAMLGIAAAAGASALRATGAFAQDWPSRSLRLVVPLGPGSTLDFSARLLAPLLTERLGQPVIVENRPGAGGNLATHAVARATPDGYTLLYSGTALAVNPHLYREPGFEPFTDFEPVSLIAQNHLVLAVRRDLPVSSVDELLSYARGRATPLTVGQAGGLVLLGAELFKSLAGIELQLVAYKSAAQSLADVVAGHVDMVFAVGTQASAHAEAGRIRLLGTSDARPRPSPLGDLAPISRWVRGFVLNGWEGVVAPAHTPREVVARVNRELVAAATSPEVRRRLLDFGYDVVASSPQEFRRAIERDHARFGRIVRGAGIQPI